MNYLQSLIRYKQWANDLLFTAATELTEEELTVSRPIVFGSIIKTLHHTYAMDLVWQANLQGTEHGFKTRNPDDYPALGKLDTNQRKLDEWYIAYVDSLSSAEIDEAVSFTFIGGGVGTMTRRDILLHVVNHGTYHRGNVTGMMYECSLEPPTTDYPVFLKQNPPNKQMQTDAAKAAPLI
ncbi:MAG: putative damage-inducible protein DinB [Candidatus Azotimanducaceae bacterium]|jgi:uncharacterized damage-inducible protein DinB